MYSTHAALLPKHITWQVEIWSITLPIQFQHMKMNITLRASSIQDLCFFLYLTSGNSCNRELYMFSMQQVESKPCSCMIWLSQRGQKNVNSVHEMIFAAPLASILLCQSLASRRSPVWETSHPREEHTKLSATITPSQLEAGSEMWQQIIFGSHQALQWGCLAHGVRLHACQ